MTLTIYFDCGCSPETAELWLRERGFNPWRGDWFIDLDAGKVSWWIDL